MSPPTSPITETTCLILPSSHLSPPPTHPTPHYLQLLELAAQAGFSVTSIQLTHLSQTSLTALESLGIESKVRETLACSVVQYSHTHTFVSHYMQGLMSGPCLIVTLLRDNAVSCFHYILKRFTLSITSTPIHWALPTELFVHTHSYILFWLLAVLFLT